MAKFLGNLFKNGNQSSSVPTAAAIRDKAISDKMSEMQVFKDDYANVYQPVMKDKGNEVEAMNEMLQKPSGYVSYMDPSDRESYLSAALDSSTFQRSVAQAIVDGDKRFVVNYQFPDETVGSGFKADEKAPGGPWKPVKGYDTDTLSFVCEADLSPAGFKVVAIEPNLDAPNAQPNGADVKNIAKQCKATYGLELEDGSYETNSPGIGALMKARVNGMTEGVSYDATTDSVRITQMDKGLDGSTRVVYMATSAPASPSVDADYNIDGLRVLKNEYGRMDPVSTIGVQGDAFDQVRNAGYGSFARNAELLNESVVEARTEYSIAKAHGEVNFYKPTQHEITEATRTKAPQNRAIYDVMQKASQMESDDKGIDATYTGSY